MKGLLWKDMLQMKATMKSLLFMMGVFIIASAFSNAGNNGMEGFAIMFCAMMAVNGMGYDEKAKWNQYELCMPISRKTIVCEKYVFGGGACVLAGLVSLLFRAMVRMMIPIGQMNMSITFANIGIGILFLSITLPFMFRFGVEKGRMIYIVLFAMFYGAVGATSVLMKTPDEQAIVESLGKTSAEVWMLSGAALVFVILSVSVMISMRVYEKREV